MSDLSELGRRTTQVLRRDGVRVVTGKVLARGADRLLSGAQPFHMDVRREDVLAPAATPRPFVGAAGDSGGGLTLNWVMNPPTELSGGMAVAMRAIRLLEARGHTCRIYALYKGARRSLVDDTAFVRGRYPDLQAEIADVDDGLVDADATIATAWPTAYVLRAADVAGARLYLVCDLESTFYASGSNATLANASYQFGFQGITLGPWLAQVLAKDYGMTCEHFDLGVDLDCYRLQPGQRRDGVVFYARPDTPRRATEIGMMALELFARRHPGVEIHLVGQTIAWRNPSFSFVNHGRLSTVELASLYNRCRAGLVLSMTNLSLLPAELLACGCIPVMNDAENTRVGFPNPHARFAAPTPEALADRLGELVGEPVGDDASVDAAASVQTLGWEVVADQLEAALRAGIERGAPRPG